MDVISGMSMGGWHGLVTMKNRPFPLLLASLLLLTSHLGDSSSNIRDIFPRYYPCSPLTATEGRRIRVVGDAHRSRWRGKRGHGHDQETKPPHTTPTPAPRERRTAKRCCATTDTNATKIVGGWRGLLVDLINPKFKAFNRPLLIGLLVLAGSLSAFILVFNHLASDCHINTYV